MQGIMIRDAGETFVKEYELIMQGHFSGDLFNDTVSRHIISAISDLSEEKIYTSSVKTRRELDVYKRQMYSGKLKILPMKRCILR